MPIAQPQLFLIAGPNGAGKTTYAFRHIRRVAGTTRFVNLDEIARGLSPFDPTAQAVRAARTTLDLAREFTAAGQSFALETTLAGRTHLRTLAAAADRGFQVILLYFAVPDPETCLARVARRVAEGGHDVPEADLRRRFTRSLANLPDYARASDLWRVFDAAGPEPRVVAEGSRATLAYRGAAALPAPLDAWLASLGADAIPRRPASTV